MEENKNPAAKTTKEKDLLKFITCGSVDDGKSTLIGHILYDAKLIFADQKRALEMESKVGSAGGDLDYSLLLDGLMAEREQGITIDVAYRYFSTEHRSFIVADTPGHEEYTRNMAVGASFADLALILIDATKGVLIQTRRHTRICMLMGIRHFVFVINKMDLVDYDKAVYLRISEQIRELVREFKYESLEIIPVSATNGDNLIKTKGRLSWYKGTPLLEYLENVEIHTARGKKGFCMPVQRVSRPDYTFRGYQGQICAGNVKVGDEVTVLPSGETARVTQILRAGREVTKASKGTPVSICLDREIDISRGCVIESGRKLHVGERFAAELLWMDDIPLACGKPYIGKIGTKQFPVMVTSIDYSIDVNTGSHMMSGRVEKNGLVHCRLSADSQIVFDSFEDTKELGEIILIDIISHATAACGVIRYALGNEGTAHEQSYSITRAKRERRNGHKARTVWFTGLSGAGKSTLANELEKRMFASGFHTIVLDGDNVRLGLNKDLGFSPEDRGENIRRTAEACRLLNEAGVLVMAAFISPYRKDRQLARQIIGDAFVEVYVSTSLEVCESRDVKGLYKKARSGEIREFTGISGDYEVPSNPEIVINTADMTVDESTEILMKELLRYV